MIAPVAGDALPCVRPNVFLPTRAPPGQPIETIGSDDLTEAGRFDRQLAFLQQKWLQDLLVVLQQVFVAYQSLARFLPGELDACGPEQPLIHQQGEPCLEAKRL